MDSVFKVQVDLSDTMICIHCLVLGVSKFDRKRAWERIA